MSVGHDHTCDSAVSNTSHLSTTWLCSFELHDYIRVPLIGVNTNSRVNRNTHKKKKSSSGLNLSKLKNRMNSSGTKLFRWFLSLEKLRSEELFWWVFLFTPPFLFTPIDGIQLSTIAANHDNTRPIGILFWCLWVNQVWLWSIISFMKFLCFDYILPEKVIG